MCVCVLFLFVVVVLFFVLFCVCNQRVVFATNVFAPSLLLLRAQKTPDKRDPLGPRAGGPRKGGPSPLPLGKERPSAPFWGTSEAFPSGWLFQVDGYSEWMALECFRGTEQITQTNTKRTTHPNVKDAVPNGCFLQITDTNISEAYSVWTAIPSGRLSQKTDTNISETIPSVRPF